MKQLLIILILMSTSSGMFTAAEPAGIRLQRLHADGIKREIRKRIEYVINSVVAQPNYPATHQLIATLMNGYLNKFTKEQLISHGASCTCIPANDILAVHVAVEFAEMPNTYWEIHYCVLHWSKKEFVKNDDGTYTIDFAGAMESP